MLIPIGPISTTCEARGPGALSPSTSGAARAPFPSFLLHPLVRRAERSPPTVCAASAGP